MLIPMSNQYEQTANALAAKQLGCTVLIEINDRFSYHLMNWLEYGQYISHRSPDPTQKLIALIQRRLLVQNLALKPNYQR